MIVTSALIEFSPPRLARDFIKYLREKNIKFTVFESSTSSIYFTVHGLNETKIKIRFSTHGQLTYKDPKVQMLRNVDLSVDPTSGKTYQDALNLVSELVA